MAKAATKAPLLTKDQVFAGIDLPRVPKGTEGKVIMVQGLSWIRYWVWFNNGERIGTLHRDKLMTADEWERRNDAPATAVVAVSASAAGPAGAITSAQADVGGVPGHLIERSRLARERWAAKAAAS
jgi:hypothetical protein